jgi:hypothetical protein
MNARETLGLGTTKTLVFPSPELKQMCGKHGRQLKGMMMMMMKMMMMRY